MLDVFLTVILPIFLVADVDTALQRWRKLSVGTLSPVTVYLLSPALVFRFLLGADLPATTSLRIVSAALLSTVAFAVVGTVVSMAMRQGRSLRSGFLLSTMFPNAGNMGLPTSLLAFGEPGLAVAVVVFVTQASIAWPLGIFIAARSRAHGFAPLLEALKVPSIYAVVAALIIRFAHWELPASVNVPVGLLADAAIPSMLVVLGFQLARGIDTERWRSLAAALMVRLVIAVPIGYAVTLALGIDGVAQKTIIAMSAMPAAVFTTLLASEFDAEPRFVSSAVVAGTLASLGTLTVVITSLDRWL